MLINGIELSNLGIQLYDRILYSNDIDTAQEWLDGDIQPTFIRQQDRFKTIKLEFLVLCSDEDEAFKRISRLTALLKKSTIKFDDLNFTFDTSIVDVGEPSRLKNGNFVVPYTLSSGYAKGQREIYTTNANMTNAFKLTVAYYKDTTTLLEIDTVTIRASMFDNPRLTFEDLGIDVDKFLPEYYNSGVVTNLNGLDLTYENLQSLQVLNINYSPVSYNITVNYYLDSGEGMYNEILVRTVSFTQPQLSKFQTIGQLVDVQAYRPVGYKAKVGYDKELTLENLLVSSPISVFYDKIDIERSKNVLVAYKIENDEGEYETIQSLYVNVTEASLYDGSVLGDIISLEGYRPNPTYYNSGYIDNHTVSELISYDTLETSYTVIYTKATNTIFVEYYAGIYPDWYRLTTATLQTKYQQKFDEGFNILKDLGIDLNKYHTAPYEDGKLYNASNFNSYDDVLNTGVLQVYYTPIDYPITVNYYTKDLNTEPIVETVNINALMFFGNPLLSDIIPIAAHRPEGYQFDENFSYSGEISLDALTQASPIMIVYEEISAVRTKNIIVRYKQELASAYSTIATNLITVSESDIIGGTRLRDVISLNAYQPEYYEAGVIDGASSSAIIKYDELASEYNVLYVAATYATPVRYYVDEVSDTSWIGSSTIAYRVIDFTTSVSLYDFGLSLNMFKPAYTSDGELLYTGPVNFSTLLDTESINVLYKTVTTPEDPDGIDYPHRFLFLQHNDLGDYEYAHPEWTMNHAFINTGISADDMSKLTVVMECARVDENVPLYQVNGSYGYLFGSHSPFGAFYMRYNNQTMYGENLTGINLYEAKAGAKSDVLSLTESAAVGFGLNTGIYSSAQQGYSRAVFTYSHTLATDGAEMPYPLYLFANNLNNTYANGIAGVGIYSCRIYYNDQLVRDFIPVQFYDKIGDKVAPSNCLYDKITETFFEDGTGLNSFNIKDDDRYTDTNLQHKIGYCYVNYYKGDELLKTSAVYFRGDDFGEDKEYDLYERFQVDENQPQYCKAGEIQDITSIDPSFDGLNGKVITVYYEPITTMITVNYYQEIAGIQNLLASEEIALQEKDFYQVPSFGDIVRLNKYKPKGYETNFQYPGSKVSMARVIDNSPYNIVYTKMTDEPVEYRTTVQYKKKVFGVREYELIDELVLTFDQSDFRDGEYIDFYIDKNARKPERFYLDGVTYHWYEMDERLDVPENLKPTYEIVYMPEKQFLDVDYYTDEVHEDNLIATTTWGLMIDELEPGYSYSIIDILPNSYINKFKPVRCNGGMVQGADVEHTFETLIEQGHIDIVYETLIEPDDPTQAYYEPKVLGFGSFAHDLPLTPNESATLANGGIIPYIDLGYKPKEMGRLKVEIKAVAQANGFLGSPCNGGWQDTSYVDFFGYRVPKDPVSLGDLVSSDDDYLTEDDLGNFYSSYISNTKKGHFSFSTRVPVSSGWVYTAEGPQFIDNQIYYTAASATGVIAGSPKWVLYGTDATFRRGLAEIYDENWEVIDCYKQYGYVEDRPIDNVNWIVNPERCPFYSAKFNPVNAIANPITTVLDAYNGYWSSWSEEDSNHAPYKIFSNEDEDIFEARLQPKGSLSLFRTTNALTGEPNIMPFWLTTRQSTTGGAGYVPGQLKGSANPYTGNYKTIEYEVLVQVGVDNMGNAIFEGKKMYKNIQYCDFPVPVFPQLEACAIWSVKIWDRDRLVRDLIPVAKGDKIYDYIMPENGLFDLVTEIFFGNSNEGGTYEITSYFENENKDEDSTQLIEATKKVEVKPEEVMPLWVIYDPMYYGKITMNYYDYDYSFITNQFVSVPTWYSASNTTVEDIVNFNDYKPDDFHLDGFLDIDDKDSPLYERMNLKELYEMGSANVMYKLRTFTKTIVYYQGNYRVGSKDIFYSLKDIENAKTLADLGIDVDLYWTEDFAHGEVIFNEDIIAQDNIQAFIDAPSPIVVYKKLSKEEAPNLLYLEYYRGGAYDEELITPDPDDENYFDCELDGVILNPHGAIKYYNHYHSALYEDEKFDYFIPYQVNVLNKYVGIHRGPARKYPTLATIVEKPVLTITEERNGWGRLKEYPVGWIMLSATEPVVGPGQNPEYDVPDTETATIPFATEIHITKLTVDRLWCYVPEVESWIKAEDVSYNQSGKLYNALGIDVIHLDEIDFSNVSTLYDMGILPNKRALYFHDRSAYAYEGEYTYEAFSNIHELEFMYPETIYNYTCIYYKDNIDGYFNGLAITTGTAYLRKEPSKSAGYETYNNAGANLVLTGTPVINTEGTWYYAQNSYGKSGYVLSTQIRIIREPQDPTVSGSNELGRASFSCSIGDWNPDWDVFIATSWQTDENGKDVNPTLYRDAELTLTWEYFGFERNLFKPDGYFDGIYLWNPRSWDRGDVHFNFRELVRTGSQTVLYPGIPVNMFKIANATNSVSLPLKNATGESPSFSLNLHKYPEGEQLNNFYDLDIVFDPSTTTSYRPSASFTYAYDYNSGSSTAYNGAYYTTNNGIGATLAAEYGHGTYRGTSGVSMIVTYGKDYVSSLTKYPTGYLKYKEPGDYFSVNISNHRPETTFVFGHGNSKNGLKEKYYLDDGTEIFNNTNIENHYGLSSFDTLYEEYGHRGTSGGNPSVTYYDSVYSTNIQPISIPSNKNASAMSVALYQNFLAQHYWVPVPKGYWYRFGGAEHRIPANGWYDLITGDFIESKESTIYFLNQTVGIDEKYDYFKHWDYVSTDVDYIVQIGEETNTYQQPDLYAIGAGSLAAGLVMPVSKVTSDAEHKVVGEWYHSCNQWFETKQASIYAGLNKSQLTKLQQTVALVHPADNKTYYVYLNPKTVIDPGASSDASYSNAGYSTTVYYHYVNNYNKKFFFDGKYWIPEDYTQFNTVEHNKNYAVIPEHLTYYSLPIEDPMYATGDYHYGERITVLYTTKQDSEWGFTGLGWIRANANTISEVI